MKSYDLYLFDLDDTLIQSFFTATSLYYPQLAKILGVSYPGDEVVRQNWRGDLFVSLEKIFRIPVVRDQIIEMMRKMYIENPVKPVEGVERILTISKKHNKFIGIYSSSFPPIMDLCITNSIPCPRSTIDFIFSTMEQQIPKPSPRIVFVMLEKYRQTHGLDPQLNRVLVVGDSIDDYKISKSANVDFAAVLTGPTARNDFIRAGLDPSRIFPTVKEAITPPTDHGVVAIIKDEPNKYLLIRESRPGHQYYGHWSGPHGVCETSDVLEEETVVRETFEECGINVKPLRILYQRTADTKVHTVSFWETQWFNSERRKFNICKREVGAIEWISLEDIQRGAVPLYPGTSDFFDHYLHFKGAKDV